MLHRLALWPIILLIYFRGFYGGVFKSSGPDNTAKADLEKENLQDLKKIKPAYIDYSEMHEYVKLMMRKEVQKEIKKHNIDSVVRSDVQKYQQGEAQRVLTPELLEAMIASSMEQVMDKYNDQLQEKVDKLNKLLQQKTEILPTKMDERLQRIEHFLLKDSGSTYDDLIQRMKTNITGHICKICKFYKTSLDRIVHFPPNFSNSLLGKYLDN